jgi:hypothetical protein
VLKDPGPQRVGRDGGGHERRSWDELAAGWTREGQEKKRKCKVKIYMVAKIAEKPWKESTGGVAKGLDNAKG